jgi:predicted nucleotidyltransferase
MNKDEKYLQMVKKIILETIDVNSYAVFLFGSRARHPHAESADFDIGVLGHQPLPDKIMFEIHEKIESSIVPYKVDVVDFYHADTKFKSIALKEIQIWNHPNSISLV